MKKNIFLFFFVLVTSFSFGQIMAPYNCNVISLSNPNNISDSTITDPDSVQLTDVEFNLSNFYRKTIDMQVLTSKFF
jgi:hypothetical protein